MTTPELNGQIFTNSFLMGFYNNKVTFYEPMVKKAFIDANPVFEKSIPQPAKFKKAGDYPPVIKWMCNHGALPVSLEKFFYRLGS